MTDASLKFIQENIGDMRVVLKRGRPVVNYLSITHATTSLNFLNSFLEQVTRKRIEDETLKVLVMQIRDTIFEAEDIMDEFVLQRAEGKGSSRNVGTWFELLVHLTETVDEVKDWQDAEEMTTQPAPTVEEENVVGLESEKETVIDLLIRGSEKLQVISIVGMCGIGKTTLAKMIFGQIKNEFHHCVWVEVSYDCNRREVFLHILGHVLHTPDDVDSMADDDLAIRLHKCLENEKYLIVLDGVWTEKNWDILKIAFPHNEKSSRILITTRHTNVARNANSEVEPYNLRFLNEDESWSLLKRAALGQENCPDELENYGRHIAGKCEGIPRAILVIGRVLGERRKERKMESRSWEIISRSVKQYIAHDLGGNMDYIIDLSFYELPSHLKACFIYFGMLPNGYCISVRKLIRLWIAEGFIQPAGNMKLEDIAESYLEDLVNMKLVMVRKRSISGKIKTCYVHDSMHVFCKMKAGEEIFYYAISQSDQTSDSFFNNALRRFRGLSILPHILNKIYPQQFEHSPRILNKISPEQFEYPTLRSLLCFSNDKVTASLAEISSIIRTNRLLRVIDVEPLYLTEFPSDLCQLHKLRYLVLSIKSETIPEQIASLWNLQSLIVNTSLNKLEIKGEISKLSRLRNLETNASTSFSCLPKEGENVKGLLVNLRKLSTISPETCTVNVFDMAPKLEKLGIRGQLVKLFEKDKGTGDSLFDNVKMLKFLKNLKLIDDIVLAVQDCKAKIDSFPCEFPPNLRKLTLDGTQLDWRHMFTLGKLTALEILKLKEYAFKGESWEVGDGEFRSLKVLVIERTDLAKWVASSDHFPSLRLLRLRHCASLEAVPSISSLRAIELHWTNRQAATSAKEIQKKMDEQKGMEFKLSIYPPHHEK